VCGVACFICERESVCGVACFICERESVCGVACFGEFPLYTMTGLSPFNHKLKVIKALRFRNLGCFCTSIQGVDLFFFYFFNKLG
jgi:hypothetical protein